MRRVASDEGPGRLPDTMETAPGSLVAVVAEKPSVARDIAAVLGATKKGAGCLIGAKHIVTWAIGHLVALPEPHQINPAWKAWRRELLPMLPANWPLVVTDRLKEQYAAVRAVLADPRVTAIVCATDAGREGELIFRQLYEATGCTKPVQRLWISSLTPDAIKDGFAHLRPAREFDRLADAARGRSRADWLVGMNFSRAFTLAGDEMLTVGRVQTPTLAMVVERELAIRTFVPREYLEVVATFSGETGSYRGTYFDPATKTDGGTRFPHDGEAARCVVSRAATGAAAIAAIDAQTRRTPPPLLFDLTELQRHANRLLGWSAKKTLEVAQRLYEGKKAITYPRTDSRYLPRSVAGTLPEVLRALGPAYKALFAPGTLERPLGSRFVDDTKVTDHHAIIPTRVVSALSGDEHALYDLIVRRLIAAWHPEHIAATTTVVTTIAGRDFLDRYRSHGTMVRQAGWKTVEPEQQRPGKSEAGDDAPPSLPPGLKVGQPQRVAAIEALERKTRPPKRFTDATLLTAMETCGKTLDEQELVEALRESGLGTPATRAEILENLLTRGYLERSAKSLVATDKGIRLIALVHPSVKSPALTGRWEAELARIQRGEGQLDAFMSGIEGYVKEIVGETMNGPALPLDLHRADAGSASASCGPTTRVPALNQIQNIVPSATSHVTTRTSTAATSTKPATDPSVPAQAARKPVPAAELGNLLKRVFGHDDFRPFQEAVCRAVTEGRDALLVMPTGAGKSLCYQLPGLARAGTTLVISPLIALMEDQVAKLRALGLAAARIHSGLERLAANRVCRDYLDGRLDFLFIAPERLAIAGFPEMLAKRTPTLVAVDEAHCISHWGHDFRPDYRLLGARLPLLRPAPVIALTATATPRVQDDIAAQLGLSGNARFIHGFRRTNIAVEVVEAPPSRRAELVLAALADPAHRPAIVYAPTRREAGSLAADLQSSMRSGAYHAGLPAQERFDVQRRFLEGRTEVIVATIAFGMGIDKPDVRTVIHTGLPGSVEGYYQEIGRAGRDGLPARAILLHSYGDTRTHEFFLGRDYPEPAILEQVFQALKAAPIAADDLRRQVKVDPEICEKALEKLWMFGGALVTPEGDASRGVEDWRRPYTEQREHRQTQLELMRRFANGSSCRMLQLVRHFGDQEDSGTRCGSCDICAPAGGTVTRLRRADPQEQAALGRTLALLRVRDGQGTGQLHREVQHEFPGLDRRTFEELLGGLARGNLARIEEDQFEKDGQTIRFRRVFLTARGRRADAVVEAQIPVAPAATGARRSGKKSATKAGKTARKRKSAHPLTRTRRAATAPAPADESAESPALLAALRQWRLTEAQRRRVPAFRILGNQTLADLAARKPRTVAELSEISGIGPARVKQYGKRLLQIVRG